MYDLTKFRPIKVKVSATRMNYTNLTDDTEGPDPEVQHPMPEPSKPKLVIFSTPKPTSKTFLVPQNMFKF